VPRTIGFGCIYVFWEYFPELLDIEINVAQYMLLLFGFVIKGGAFK
jgi:hypothetical protein